MRHENFFKWRKLNAQLFYKSMNIVTFFYYSFAKKTKKGFVFITFTCNIWY